MNRESSIVDFVDWIRGLPSDEQLRPTTCAIGTVGWEGVAAHFEKGEADNDGHTLVRVTLYGGKAPYEPAKAGVAQGREVVAMMSAELGRIPPKGARVYVLFPTGMELTPGAGVIVASVEPGREVNDNLGAGHATLASSGGAARVTVKEDGSIVLFTTSDNTKDGLSISVVISPTKFQINAPWGRLTFDDTGFHVTHVSGAAIDMGAIGGLPAPFDVIASYIALKAAMVSTPAALVSMANPAGIPVQLADAESLLVVLADIQLRLGGVAGPPSPAAAAIMTAGLGTNASASK